MKSNPSGGDGAGRWEPAGAPPVYIGLGTNLPFEGASGAVLLARALGAIKAAGLKVLAASSAFESAPWPPSDQPPFVNGAAQIGVGALSPEAVYGRLREVEEAFGRERRVRWEARTLDLDVLDFGGLVGRFGDLDLPHPRLHERIFALAPLAEIAPDWLHPELRMSAASLMARAPEGQRTQALGPIPGFQPRCVAKPGAGD